MDYIIAVQTPAYRLDETTVAVESAFGQHLLELHRTVCGWAERLVLIAPQMSTDDYYNQRSHLRVLDATADSVIFVPAYRNDSKNTTFWFRELPQFIRRLWALTKSAGVVHSGMSFDIKRPMLAVVNAVARARRRPLLFIVDIDFRGDPRRYRETGQWGFIKYAANTLVLNPFRWIQVKLAPRMSDLVLLKGGAMVEDFGSGHPHVKHFYDAAHSTEHVLTGRDLQMRLEWLKNTDGPFIICYFGRLVWKKGIDRIIEALFMAREQGHDVRLKIIGDGDMREALSQQVSSYSLEPFVEFHRQVPYGHDLFDLLAHTHLSVAAPLVEDTPRSAFDSLARALPILAFDIGYFSDLAGESAGVMLTPWPRTELMAERIAGLASDRSRLASMAAEGAAFALSNAQQVWLDRRAGWTREFLVEPAGTRGRTRRTS